MKLHLGCWKRYIPDFIHIDNYNYKHIDYNRDIRDLSFLNKNSCDLIYASHVIEYFDYDELVIVLKNWKRVLKKGGELRLSVPNFDALIKVYNKTKSIKSIIGPLYGKMKFSNQKNNLIYHKIVFNKKLLSDLLAEAGFINFSSWDWRTTEHRHIDDHSQAYFPHMQKEKGILISLNFSAFKK